MYSIDVKMREAKIKAGKLRRIGMVPGSIYGGGLEEAVLIQIPKNVIRKLLKEKKKGEEILLKMDAASYTAVIQEVSHDLVKDETLHITFEKLGVGAPA